MLQSNMNEPVEPDHFNEGSLAEPSSVKPWFGGRVDRGRSCLQTWMYAFRFLV